MIGRDAASGPPHAVGSGACLTRDGNTPDRHGLEPMSRKPREDELLQGVVVLDDYHTCASLRVTEVFVHSTNSHFGCDRCARSIMRGYARTAQHARRLSGPQRATHYPLGRSGFLRMIWVFTRPRRLRFHCIVVSRLAETPPRSKARPLERRFGSASVGCGCGAVTAVAKLVAVDRRPRLGPGFVRQKSDSPVVPPEQLSGTPPATREI